jgi:carboxyl-terminal processing protease
MWMGMLLSFPCFAVEEPAAASVEPQEAGCTPRQIIALIEQGRWDEADTLLARQDTVSSESLARLRDVLDEYQAMQKRRDARRQQIFAEQNEILTATFTRIVDNDPNVNYQEALKQVQNVWKDASDSQRKQFFEQEPFLKLLEHARQIAQNEYAQGQWSKASNNGVRWLLAFDPENPDSLNWETKLNEVNAILEFLKNDPCEDKHQRFASIDRETVRQIFLILQAHYVKPLDFNEMARRTLDRCEALADVLKTAPTDLIIQVDPEKVTRWAEQIYQCCGETAQLPAEMDIQAFEVLQDALLALNEKTMNVPKGFLLAMMADAALTGLDAYTTVIWPYAVDNFNKSMTGQFGGVGIHISKEKDGFRVTSLIPDSPALKAGLQADAMILAVDGESTRDMSAACAVQKISGPVGTSVALTIRYPDTDTDQLLTVTRSKIVLPVVEGSRQADTGNEGRWDYFLDEENHIGYLSLKNFTERTVPQVKAALEQMENAGLAGLILDIRGNGGGLLTAAVEVSDLFVDGAVLLKSKGRDETFNEWPATINSASRRYPLVVLIDGASASASEIVAGVLGAPANKRAMLVGSRSYGKGSVQEIVSLGSDKGKLKYTSAYYYLPDGSPVKSRETVAPGSEDWGVVPDIAVPLYDFERQQIREVNARRTRISNIASADEGPEEAPVREQLLLADPQLATALLVLKAQIADSK